MKIEITKEIAGDVVLDRGLKFSMIPVEDCYLIEVEKSDNKSLFAFRSSEDVSKSLELVLGRLKETI